MKRIPLIFVAAVVLPASAQERVPGAEQHVTVPSAPGQSNKETVVQPSAAIKTGKYGWIQQGERPATSGVPKVPARAGRASIQPDLGTSGNAPYVPAPAGPSGPAVVGAAYVSVRGIVTAYAKNAITILEKSGRQRQVSLAPRALVYEGLKPGDEVVLRIPFDEGADCRTADRVERPPAPKAPPKSKFSQAQSTGS
ncbi:MAG: hypothetical protein ACHQPI_15015 [Thermoanaerobaculia bacterium]